MKQEMLLLQQVEIIVFTLFKLTFNLIQEIKKFKWF